MPSQHPVTFVTAYPKCQEYQEDDPTGDPAGSMCSTGCRRRFLKFSRWSLLVSPLLTILLINMFPIPAILGRCAHSLRKTDSENKELDMGTFAYSRCMECDEEKFFSDGLRCALCLGLSYRSTDEERDDNTEESSRTSLELVAAA